MKRFGNSTALKTGELELVISNTDIPDEGVIQSLKNEIQKRYSIEDCIVSMLNAGSGRTTFWVILKAVDGQKVIAALDFVSTFLSCKIYNRVITYKNA